MQKVTLASCAVLYNPAAVQYSTLLDRILCLVCFILIMMLLSPLSHRHGKPETIADLCFLHPMRLPVTAGRWSLSLLDKLNILSNFGSFSMVLLH